MFLVIIQNFNNSDKLKMSQEKKRAKLRIERLEKSRSGRSLCYIDQYIMIALALNTGDIIEIRGKKKTTGIAVSSVSNAYPESHKELRR